MPDDSEWEHGAGFYLFADDKPDRHYVLMARGEDDPERSKRPKGGRKDKTPHRSLAKSSEDDWHEMIAELFYGERPRELTLNAISVEVMDLTADITVWTPFGRAVLDLVGVGYLEMTTTAPILFRRRRSSDEEAWKRARNTPERGSAKTQRLPKRMAQDDDGAEGRGSGVHRGGVRSEGRRVVAAGLGSSQRRGAARVRGL